MKTHNHFDDLEADDIHLIISRFDKDADGRISLNEVSIYIFQILLFLWFSSLSKWSPNRTGNTEAILMLL